MCFLQLWQDKHFLNALKLFLFQKKNCCFVCLFDTVYTTLKGSNCVQVTLLDLVSVESLHHMRTSNTLQASFLFRSFLHISPQYANRNAQFILDISAKAAFQW